MGRISTYLHVSADGYFAGPGGDIAWFKQPESDPESGHRLVTGSARGAPDRS